MSDKSSSPSATLDALITVAEDFEEVAARMERENVSSAQGIHRDWLRESARIIRGSVSALSERGEPVAYGVQALSDGSIRDEIAPVKWTMFEHKMNALRKDPWVVNGAAKIVPLYLASVPSAIQQKRCETCDGVLELHCPTCDHDPEL